MKMLAAIKEKIGRNLFTNFLPERAHYSQAMQEHVPVWRFDKDVRTSLPPMRAFLEEAMTRIGSHKRSEEHTSELQSLMRISYAVFCLKKTKQNKRTENQPLSQLIHT